MQFKDVTPIIKAILEERDKIPRIIDKERYISNPQPYHDGDFMRGGIRKALRVIEQAPVVDAVPVVRCKDCKYYVPHTYCTWCDNPMRCNHPELTFDTECYDLWLDVGPEDFCSRGERRMEHGI